MTPIARRQTHKANKVEGVKRFDIEIAPTPLPQDVSFSEN